MCNGVEELAAADGLWAVAERVIMVALAGVDDVPVPLEREPEPPPVAVPAAAAFSSSARRAAPTPAPPGAAAAAALPRRLGLSPIASGGRWRLGAPPRAGRVGGEHRTAEVVRDAIDGGDGGSGAERERVRGEN